MKLSITSLFSVQIIIYLGASDIIYSDVIDSFISEILKYKSWILASWRKKILDREIHTIYIQVIYTLINETFRPEEPGIQPELVLWVVQIGGTEWYR